MVTANASKLQNELDSLRKNRKKFICLNDDIDYGEVESSNLQMEQMNLVKELLHNFYTSFLPHSSPFELPKGQVNSVLYVQPYKKRMLEKFKMNRSKEPSNVVYKKSTNSTLTMCLLVQISLSTSVMLALLILIFRIVSKVSICFRRILFLSLSFWLSLFFSLSLFMLMLWLVSLSLSLSLSLSYFRNEQWVSLCLCMCMCLFIGLYGTVACFAG